MYSIHMLLREGSEKFRSHEYIFERRGGSFEGVTFARFAEDVNRLAGALLGLDLGGRTVILFGENSYYYMAADIAIMGYVGVSSTISKEWQAGDLIRAAEHLSAAAVIYSAQKSDVVEQLREKHPELTCICFDELPAMLEGQTSRELTPRPADACCKIIFSSGTTGMPKAVMLSQDNMFANWESLRRRSPFTQEDKDYLFLPLSHTYGGICNFLYSLISGMKLYICSDTKLIAEELQMVKPTVFCAVPIIFEKMYAASKASGVRPSHIFGGNVRYLFNGGAYLRPEIRECFKADGLNFLEAYGLSETSSLISCEYSNPEDITSVGTVLENIEIRTSDPDEDGNGEIFVRGANIFMGYYNNDEATEAAFSDGWFRTGDLGQVRDGRLYLKGRKRRMILLSHGENVYPDEIEVLFAGYPQLNKVKVYERDKQICAALYVNAECDSTAIIAEVNAKLPKFAHIRSTEVINDNIETRMK